jgi:hypothetical protein
MPAPDAPRLALLIATCLLAPAAPAEVYKWIDDQGVTQYSQTPPPDNQYDAINPDPAPTPDPADAERLRAQREALEARGAERAKQHKESSKSAEESAKRKVECDVLRERLATLENNPRINTYGEGGQVERLTEDKRQADITQLRALIGKDCGR